MLRMRCAVQKAKAPITDSGSSSTEGLFCVSSVTATKGGRSLSFYVQHRFVLAFVRAV